MIFQCWVKFPFFRDIFKMIIFFDIVYLLSFLVTLSLKQVIYSVFEKLEYLSSGVTWPGPKLHFEH